MRRARFPSQAETLGDCASAIHEPEAGPADMSSRSSLRRASRCCVSGPGSAISLTDASARCGRRARTVPAAVTVFRRRLLEIDVISETSRILYGLAAPLAPRR